MSASSSPETRRCRGECGRELPLDVHHFRQTKGGRPGGKRSLCWVGVCRDCERVRNRTYYREARTHVLAQQRAARSGSENRERYMKDYNRRNRKKLNKQARERHRLMRARQRAPIPWEVAQPYLDDLLTRVFRPIALDRMIGGAPNGFMVGIGPMAEAAGVDPTGLKRILRGDRPGVNQRVLDRLAAYGDFTLPELIDRAREWAVLTNDPWPRGYYGSGLSTKTSTGKVS